MFFKIGVLKNFATFTEKQLRWRLSLIKARPAFLLKWDSNTGVSLWILKKFQEQIFWQNTSGGCFCNSTIRFVSLSKPNRMQKKKKFTINTNVSWNSRLEIICNSFPDSGSPINPPYPTSTRYAQPSSPHFASAFTIIIFVLFTLFLLILIKTILEKLHSILTLWKTTRFNFLVVSINSGHGKRKISQEKRGCFWIWFF